MDIVIGYCNGLDFRYLDLVKSEKYYNFCITESMFYLSKDSTIQDGVKYIYKSTNKVDGSLLSMDLGSKMHLDLDDFSKGAYNLMFSAIHFRLINFSDIHFEIDDNKKSFFGNHKMIMYLLDLDSMNQNHELNIYKNKILSQRRDFKILDIVS